MKILLDTSVLVAAMVEAHPAHERGKKWFNRVTSGTDKGLVAAHSIAELYAILTTLPVQPPISVSDAKQLIQKNVAEKLEIVSLSSEDYLQVVNQLAEIGIVGGATYDALKYAPQGEIKISGQALPEQVIVCVSDDGPGIEAKDLPHIFDRFYRSTAAVKHTKGAGLGLYLARAIVEAHGGRIWVDPQPNTGARICFSLPR